MRRIIFIIITLGVALCLEAQSPNTTIDGSERGRPSSQYNADYFQEAGDNAALYYGRIEQPIAVTSAWRGHQYWEDAEFHRGTVSYDGVLYDPVMLRYDILSNELVVLTPERQISVVPDQDKIDYFTIDGLRYVCHDGWFARVVADGAYELLHTRVKKLAGDIIEDRQIWHMISTSDQYYLRDPNGKVTKVSSLKDLCRACPGYADRLKALKKEKKLKFNSKTRGYDLAECVTLIDSCCHGTAKQGKTEAKWSKRQTTPTPSSATENIPDSIFASIIVPPSMVAYHAYMADQKPEYEDTANEHASTTPGITALDPTKEALMLREVEVTATKSKSSTTHTGMETFRPALLKNVPMAMGENDVLKLATMLPGVTSTGEASSGLNVRGGGSDQNLTLYNGNTLFNPTHMFGLFSVFNSDMISETELFKGGLPSQYGGRLSSVMNIKGRSANKEKFSGSASIGLVTSKAMLELPIKRNRASLLLGARTTYSDWMLKKLPESSGYRNGEAGFWDLSATLSSMVGKTGNLLVSGYYSQDRFAFTDFDKYGYSNLNASAEYRARINDHATCLFSMGYDHYDYHNNNIEDEYSAARLSFSLNQYFVRGSAIYRLNDHHSVMSGVQSQFYAIMPGRYEPIGASSNIVGRKLADDKGVESAVFAEDNWQINENMTIVGGVRLNVFNALRQGMEKAYINPDLRLSATYKINDQHTLKLGLNTQHQYIHKVSNTVIMSPTDTWMLSNDVVKPQRGWQASAGYFWQTPARDYEISAEVYYKGMNEYLTYRSGAQLVMNPHLENDVVVTNGRAYGIEVQLTKPAGKLNGWISYSYSCAELRQTHSEDGVLINGGAWFPTDFDSPHVFKLVGNYKFTRRYSMSLNVDYSTGRPYTAPVAQYYDHNQDIILPLYSERNKVRMPDYFRVDWSFNIEPSHHLTNLTHSWLTIGVYNLLGRKNAYSIYFQYDQKQIQGYMLSIFGAPIPYVSYNIRF